MKKSSAVKLFLIVNSHHVAKVEYYWGQRVRLDLYKLAKFSLFPGQVNPMIFFSYKMYIEWITIFEFPY